ncbi:MAG: vanadium-dependent haloperoxidase [Bacteroidetes bacterium]|nr:vanadium-dependent haloperoxidase [Bacteroidota bacterium]
MKRLISIISLSIFFHLSYAKKSNDHSWMDGKIQNQVFAITKIMFHDVTDPTAAARFYAYCNLTGYEILYQKNRSLPHLQENFSHYPEIDVKSTDEINIEFSALYGILETGKAILPSGYMLQEDQENLYKEFIAHHVSKKILDNSIAFAKSVSNKIVQYSKQDGYFQLSTLPRYNPIHADSAWQPTPPEYMSAVQPHWRTIRVFFLDSATQFKPKSLVAFNKDTGSAFYKLAFDVYDRGKHLTKEQKLIANFWDCNPFAVQFQGHMSLGLKKISPGGHWMGITGIVCMQRKLDFVNTMFIHAIVAISLHDAFVSCWDEKYRSNRIRPETVINKYIDEKWQPILQTPPFPEYTSGHSVISTTAAIVLARFFGDHYSFTDSTENYIGLPPRKFRSFIAASDEACISRFYGGIHYMDSIDNGKEEGQQIGNFILSKLPREFIK